MFKVYITYKFLRSTPYELKKFIPSRLMSTLHGDVVFENVSGKGVITLNRPKALNALNLSMVKKILPKLQQWECEKDFVIIKGAGDKAFCAGGDVREIVEANRCGEKQLGRDFFRLEYTMNGLIGSYQKPYIALIDGITMGGGVGLSIHGKYRVATERTLFAMPETQIALFPDVGTSYFLPKLPKNLGMFLALTGYRLKGYDNLAAGIATHYVDSCKMPILEMELLNCCNEEHIKQVLESYDSKEKIKFTLADHLDKINKYFDEPTVECIFLNLKNDKSDWAKATLETLQKMSPTSMKVTKALLDKSAKECLSLEQCLSLEYRVAYNTLERKEFNEGVRALLIDKDQKPKWSPKTLEDVTDEIVECHFQALPSGKELKLNKPCHL